MTALKGFIIWQARMRTLGTASCRHQVIFCLLSCRWFFEC
jgi:hypothetical protein